MKDKLFWTVIKSYKWKSIFFRNLALILIIIILPFVFFGYSFLAYYNYNLKKEIISYATHTNNEICTAVDTMLASVTSNYSIIASNETVSFFLYNEKYQSANKLSYDTNNIVSTLKNTLLFIPYIDSVYLYNIKSKYVLSTASSNTLEKFCDPGWYALYQNNNGRDYISHRTTSIYSETHDYITICKNIYTSESAEGVVVFNINTEKLKQLLIGSNDSINELYIADSDGFIIFSESSDMIGKNLSSYPQLAQSSYSSSFATISSAAHVYGYQIVTKHSTSFFNEQLKLYNILFFFTVLIIILSSTGIAYSISSHFYKSIIKMMKVLQQEPESEESFSKSITDEYQFISNNILSIKTQKQDIETELAKRLLLLKKSQLNALQEQINPHFIFNSLSLISLKDMTEHKKQTSITKMVSLLSDILRSVLDTSEYMVPLETELTYLNKYIELQNIKYENKFNLVLNIEEDTKELAVVKFMLQPIAENSINHGILLSKEKRGMILISAKIQNKFLLIEICDNGIGMDKNKLEDIQNRLQNNEFPEKKHIGLCNVHQRIKLVFGDSYGCSINSNETGTTVSIKLPLVN